jgi:hypothetical protein
MVDHESLNEGQTTQEKGKKGGLEHLTSPYLWFVLSRTSDLTLSVVCVV